MLRQPQDSFWHHGQTDEIQDERSWLRKAFKTIHRSQPYRTQSNSVTDIGESTGRSPNLTVQDIEIAEDVQIDQALITRNICYIGLCFGWITSATCIILAALLLEHKSSKVPSWLVGRVATIGPNAYSWVPNPTSIQQELYLPNHRAFHVPHGVMVTISLLLNITLTFVFDGINLIHMISLRWQMWLEKSLEFNSNLRLFNSTMRHGPNKWYSNIISAVAIILSYGGLSVLEFPITVLARLGGNNATGLDLYPDFDSPHYGLDFNAWGLLALGIGLLLQSFLSTWCLVQTSQDIGTWSSNPLAVARACKHLDFRRGDFQDVQTASSITVTELLKSTLPGPRLWSSGNSQSSSLYSINPTGDGTTDWNSRAYMQHEKSATQELYHSKSFHSRPSTQAGQSSKTFFMPERKRVTYVLWTVTALASIWTIVTATISVKTGTATQEYVNRMSLLTKPDAFTFLTNFGQIMIVYDSSIYIKSREWIGLIIQSFALALPILGIHFAEIIVQLCRDEAIWQRASTAKGANPDSIGLLENAQFWPFWIFFIIKCLIPWIYSFAITSFSAVTMTIIPLSVVTFLFWVLSIFIEYLVRRQPRGPQPSTFGNIKAMLELVDDWSQERIYWK